MTSVDDVSDGPEGSVEPEQPWKPKPRRLPINVADLRRRLGQRKVETIDIILERQVVVGSRTLERPVVGSVTVESIERGVSAYGPVSFAWEGDCRRCLEPVRGELRIEIDEIFQVNAPDDADIINFDGDQIDLVPVVRDAVALSLPLAPLCSDDCAGPDPDRYPAMTDEQLLAEEEAERAQRGPDPRWSGLDQLDLS